jgi:hypothetical protein
MDEGRGCYLEQWCLYVYRLKSGFSKVDFDPLFIHNSWPPTVWTRILLSDSGYFVIDHGYSSPIPIIIAQ